MSKLSFVAEDDFAMKLILSKDQSENEPSKGPSGLILESALSCKGVNLHNYAKFPKVI